MNKSILIAVACLVLPALALLADTSTHKEKPMYTKMTANLMVNDVNKTLDFYEQIMGFKTLFVVVENSREILNERPSNRPLVFALIKSDNVEIMFQSRQSMAAEFTAIKDADPYASATFYLEVADVDRLYKRVKGKVPILVKLQNKPYGKREFSIRDNNGYILTFASAIKS